MSRRFAATDLHGCLRTFRYLVEQELHLRPADHLYLLGDYVNKGPDSRGVLDYIMQLQDFGYQVQCLRGNHEHELLATIHGTPNANDMWKLAAERAMTLASFGVARAADIPAQYVRWMAALPLTLELPDFVLVHAGFDFALPPDKMQQDTHSILYTRNFVFDPSRLAGRRLLHGHVPTPVAEVQASVAARAGAIGLDTGCAFRLNPELRHLAALDLDTWQLHLVENREEDYSIAKR
ncbi:metallophosphoesterase family protein [Hymenobacter cheonanensis]|uniref:metallophosphoesterase family protein n=1 Tax=Hymenobacter sp. CA2-7 TaxID=3063993 RepID=UPI002712D72A|nr:metallophosphoesterase family protein [Hymenobacter sp. CA2-7]MDO7886141.1 metallophosphoesterase family protein [Hymenobacter sp. CA2-7]